MGGEEPFGVQRRHTAHARSRHGLAIDVVAHIPRRENARNGGEGGARLHIDITAIVHIDLAAEQRCRRVMADRDENAVHRQFAPTVIHRRTKVETPHRLAAWRVFAQNLANGHVPDGFNLLMGEDPVLEDFLRPQRVAAVHQIDLGREIGEEQRFFSRGVAAADHGDFFLAIEKAVAGRAGRDPESTHRRFARHVQPARLCARGDDHRLPDIGRAGIALGDEGAPREIDLGDHVIDDFGADMGGLITHLLHQPGALDDVGEAGVVLDICCDGQLAAGLNARYDDRLQIRPRRINRGGVPGGAGSDDQDRCALFVSQRRNPLNSILRCNISRDYNPNRSRATSATRPASSSRGASQRSIRPVKGRACPAFSKAL